LILDSSVLIHLERGGSIDFCRWDEHGEAMISAVTASELLVGVHRADTDGRRAKRAAFVEAVISRLIALPFDLEVARVHAEVTASLMRQGALIGAHDCIIAATALSHGCAVLTSNVAEFARVPGLHVEAFP